MRKSYLDWVRVLAVALVIFNHLPAHADGSAPGAGFGLTQILSALARMNVPLLFMVSGALLLGREETVAAVLRKRFCRFALTLAVFSVGLYLFRLLHDTVLHGDPFSPSLSAILYGLPSNTLSLADTSSYWYLYAYLGYLLTLPFLRPAARVLDKSRFILLIVLHALFTGALPLLNLLLSACGAQQVSLSPYFTVPLAVTKALFYALAGYWLDTRVRVEDLSRKTLALLALTALAAAFAIRLLLDPLGEAAVPIADWLIALPVFLLIRRLVTVTFPGLGRGKTAARVASLSALTFGIYLLDPYLRLALFGIYYQTLSPVMSSLPLSLGWVAVSMAVGGAVTWVLQRIPGVRFLLGGKKTAPKPELQGG